MKVAVMMGSDSDWPILKPAVEILKSFGIESEVIVASAHRTPAKVREVVLSAPEKGIGAFIVAAGAGMDALLSTVQMPSGIPVATMAVNGAKNAAIFAVEIFAVADKELAQKLADYRTKMIQEVEKKAARVAAQL